MLRKRPVVLSVPLPCAEDLAAMPKGGGGRYCGSCKKIVTDFTHLTDRELTEHLRKHGFGCGTFRNDQLERPLIAPATKNRWHRWAAALALLAGFAKEGSAQQHSVPASATAPSPSPKNDTLKQSHAAEDFETLPVQQLSESRSTVTSGLYQAPGGILASPGGRNMSSTFIVDGVVQRKRPFFRRLLFWKKN